MTSALTTLVVDDSMASPTTSDPAGAYAAATTTVRSLRAERDALRASIGASERRLDTTRVRMAEMNLELRRRESEYEQAYAEFCRSLVAMYKVRDRLVWMRIIDHLGLGQMSSEYEFFSRIVDAQQRLVAEVRLRRTRVSRLQKAIAELKVDRLTSVGDLRDRLASLDGSLQDKELELRQAKAVFQDAVHRDGSLDTARAPEPGIGGFLAAANDPPRGLAPTGRGFAGLASWYGPGFQGERTANGEAYNMYAFTCASRTLPFNTWLRVTYGGRAVFLRVNDRGPVLPERVLDLSYAGATALGFSGVAYVEAEIWAR